MKIDNTSSKQALIVTILSIVFLILSIWAFSSTQSAMRIERTTVSPFLKVADTVLSNLNSIKIRLEGHDQNQANTRKQLISLELHSLDNILEHYINLLNQLSITDNQLQRNFSRFREMLEKSNDPSSNIESQVLSLEEKVKEHILMVESIQKEDFKTIRNTTVLIFVFSLFLIIFAFYQIYTYKKLISQHKKLNYDLEAEKVKSFRSAKLASLGELASGIAHEINNPLAIISGNVNRLLRLDARGELTKEDKEKGLQRIDKTVMRISKIVNSLKNLSRDTHNDQFVMTSFNQMYQEIHSLIDEKIKRHGINYIEKIEFDDVMVPCRGLEVEQVFINIFNNAIDAVKGIDEPFITFKARVSNQKLEVRIMDNGHGIPEELKEKIMLPFFTTKVVGSGTGLGLSLSQQIITHHKGNISLEETEGLTTFLVSIPLNR